MFETAIIGTCMSCIAPASLSATIAVIAIGIGLAVQSERRKLVHAKSKRL